MKNCLLNLDLGELTNLILSLGEKKFRALQIFSNLHLGKDIEDITTLSKDFRARLKAN